MATVSLFITRTHRSPYGRAPVTGPPSGTPEGSCSTAASREWSAKFSLSGMHLSQVLQAWARWRSRRVCSSSSLTVDGVAIKRRSASLGGAESLVSSSFHAVRSRHRPSSDGPRMISVVAMIIGMYRRICRLVDAAKPDSIYLRQVHTPFLFCACPHIDLDSLVQQLAGCPSSIDQPTPAI